VSKATKEIRDNARDRESFPALGVTIAAGQVWVGTGIAGPVRGASAVVTETPVNRIAGPVAASLVIGPVGLLGALTKKVKATSVVILANGRTVERRHDGNISVRNTQVEAARFNARTRAG
jgi:hypothetical protein